jgi:hypothetical protein
MDLGSQGRDSKLMLFVIVPGVKKLLRGPVTTVGFPSKPDDMVPFRSGLKPEARNHPRYVFRKPPFYSQGRKRYPALTVDLVSGIMKIKTSILSRTTNTSISSWSWGKNHFVSKGQ